MDACLRCQAESKVDARSLGAGAGKDCVVVWGECNHSFHHCCMSLWIKQNNRCPLCQQEWTGDYAFQGKIRSGERCVVRACGRQG